VSKFACCRNLFWQFGIDFIQLKLFLYATVCMTITLTLPYNNPLVSTIYLLAL